LPIIIVDGREQAGSDAKGKRSCRAGASSVSFIGLYR
jgi:hypothetical protein